MDKGSWVVLILFLIILVMGFWWYFNIGSKFDSLGGSKSISNDCSSDSYNCGDFLTQKEAQLVFEDCGGVDNDIHQLDRDGNGLACEALPS